MGRLLSVVYIYIYIRTCTLISKLKVRQNRLQAATMNFEDWVQQINSDKRKHWFATVHGKMKLSYTQFGLEFCPTARCGFLDVEAVSQDHHSDAVRCKLKITQLNMKPTPKTCH